MEPGSENNTYTRLGVHVNQRSRLDRMSWVADKDEWNSLDWRWNSGMKRETDLHEGSHLGFISCEYYDTVDKLCFRFRYGVGWSFDLSRLLHSETLMMKLLPNEMSCSNRLIIRAGGTQLWSVTRDREPLDCQKGDITHEKHCASIDIEIHACNCTWCLNNIGMPSLNENSA